jgi:hypothetical protein
MKLPRSVFVLVVFAAVAAACSTNGTAVNPSAQRVDLSKDKLQFVVGTANIAFDSTVGLNVVATFRQPNGLSAVLLDTPTITGPSGFVVPPTAPPLDAGTNHISGSPQVMPTPSVPATTFDLIGGVFSYGFGPFNSDNSGTAFYPGNPNTYPNADYNEPFYAKSANAPVSLGGPPAYPFFNDGTYPPAFAGYSQGFAAFEAAPVAGAYSLSVNVPIASGPSWNFTANATLSNLAPLPALGKPAFTKSGAGGGMITLTVPADARIVETIVYVENTTAGTFFAIGPLAGSGALIATLPDKLGPCSGGGCQNGPNATASLASGDSFVIYAVTYDYPAFEAGPPGNTNQTPVIAGAGGQADVSISRLLLGTY